MDDTAPERTQVQMDDISREIRGRDLDLRGFTRSAKFYMDRNIGVGHLLMGL